MTIMVYALNFSNCQIPALILKIVLIHIIWLIPTTYLKIVFIHMYIFRLIFRINYASRV